MKMAAGIEGVTLAEWFSAEPPFGTRYEVQDGVLVASEVGENPHALLAYGLAKEFEKQWPDVVPCPPGTCVLDWGGPGRVRTGRIPDVLIADESLFKDPTFEGVPYAAVEIWSPGNRKAERDRKRREYRAAGLQVFVEGWVTAQDVRLEWYVPLESRWALHAAASGDEELVVEGERPFRVVPNRLMRR